MMMMMICLLPILSKKLGSRAHISFEKWYFEKRYFEQIKIYCAPLKVLENMGKRQLRFVIPS